MRRAITLLAAVLTTVALAQGGSIKVGILLPFTGQYDWVGANVQPVAQMIADEVNQSGGIGGRDIVFSQGDTEGTVDAGFTAAQKLVNVDNVVALLGPTSLSFSGSKQLIQDTAVPMVSPTAGTTELDKAGTKSSSVPCRRTRWAGRPSLARPPTRSTWRARRPSRRRC